MNLSVLGTLGVKDGHNSDKLHAVPLCTQINSYIFFIFLIKI